MYTILFLLFTIIDLAFNYNLAPTITIHQSHKKYIYNCYTLLYNTIIGNRYSLRALTCQQLVVTIVDCLSLWRILIVSIQCPAEQSQRPKEDGDEIISNNYNNMWIIKTFNESNSRRRQCTFAQVTTCEVEISNMLPIHCSGSW